MERQRTEENCTARSFLVCTFSVTLLEWSLEKGLNELVFDTCVKRESCIKMYQKGSRCSGVY
jgi:hypothetical protein